MAVRFAGDFFGVPLTTPEEDRGSELLRYFPELKTIKKQAGQEEGARLYGGAKAVGPFTGFKTLEAPDAEQKAAPVFTGFKTFEQPK
jgi:hypothetical protein